MPAPAALPAISDRGEDEPRRERHLLARVVELAAVAETFRVEQGRLGAVLADHGGRTLYAPVAERADPSACGDGCLGAWRPLAASEAIRPAAPFGRLQRADGSWQWSYEGRPLYRWIGDENPGDVTGDGVDGVWFAVLVRPG
ncbi:hypothetical protein CKO27_01930 [Thiocystis violacea]|nr:hypothetical protein [Thiocystis violacea]